MSASKHQHPTEAARIEQIINDNPQVDKAQLLETRRMLKGLKDQGIAGPTYGIISPYERSRLRAARKS
jgi:hypothetical protein